MKLRLINALDVLGIRFAQSQESAALPAALAVGRLAAVILSTQGTVDHSGKGAGLSTRGSEPLFLFAHCKDETPRQGARCACLERLHL